MIKIKNEKGLSLLEILIVITIFSVLGVLITQSVILTLTGSRKSEATVRVRENLNYSLNIIERQLRNASSVVPCPNDTDTSRIDYYDQSGKASSFSCENTGTTGSFIASGSAKLTGTAVNIVECSFVCTTNTMSNPDLVEVNLTLSDGSAAGVHGANVSASTQIYLRNY
jgi:prepilin-type N-terminal cleavage/methylation domain-containing protein